jgi:hypothetical protein
MNQIKMAALLTVSFLMVSATTEADSGRLRRSDIPFSPRFGCQASSDWEKHFHSFGATRIVWTYDPASCREAFSSKDPVVPIAGTFTFWVPRGHPDAPKMYCYDEKGTPKVMKFSNGTNYYRDFNSPEWFQHALNDAKRQLRLGVRSFHHDDFAVINSDCHRKQGSRWVQSRNAFLSYISRMRQTLNEELQKMFANGEVPTLDTVSISGNITNRGILHAGGKASLQSADFLISEFYDRKDGQNLASLLSFFEFARPLSGVSAVTVASPNVLLNQRILASTYALGLTYVAPWSVYQAATLPRFTVNPNYLHGFYGMVRMRPELFDDYVIKGGNYGHGRTNSRSAFTGKGHVTGVVSRNGMKVVYWSRRNDFKKISEGRLVFINGNRATTRRSSSYGDLVLSSSVNVKIGDVISLDQLDDNLVAVSSNEHGNHVVHVVHWGDQNQSFYHLALKSTYFQGSTFSLLSYKFNSALERYEIEESELTPVRRGEHLFFDLLMSKADWKMIKVTHSR